MGEQKCGNGLMVILGDKSARIYRVLSCKTLRTRLRIEHNRQMQHTPTNIMSHLVLKLFDLAEERCLRHCTRPIIASSDKCV